MSVTDDGSLYVSLAVWATRLRRQRGLPPDVQNDFVFGISREQSRAVLDANGDPVLDADGNVASEDFLLTAEELRAFVREHMRAWIRRHVAEKRANGDLRSTWLKRRTDRDPRGVLEPVAGIVGEEFDE